MSTTITTIAQIADHVGDTITLRGWLQSRRSSGRIHFLTVRDGTGLLQAVMSKKAVGDATFQRADHLGQETSLVVTGAVREDLARGNRRRPRGRPRPEATSSTWRRWT